MKIEDEPKVTQEISAQDTALLKTGRFIERLQIKHGGVNLFPRKGADHNFRQQCDLHIFRHARRAKHPHAILLNESQRFVKLGRALRQNADSRAGVDDEIQGLADAFDRNFAAEKATRGGAHPEINSVRRNFGVEVCRRQPVAELHWLGAASLSD